MKKASTGLSIGEGREPCARRAAPGDRVLDAEGAGIAGQFHQIGRAGMEGIAKTVCPLKGRFHLRFEIAGQAA